MQKKLQLSPPSLTVSLTASLVFSFSSFYAYFPVLHFCVRLPIDTTGGDQPRGTYIGHNIFRELGIFQKQSSAVFQAESGLSVIENNWVYNGPRAGINYNDDSMGGSIIQNNTMFNLCRESG